MPGYVSSRSQDPLLGRRAPLITSDGREMPPRRGPASPVTRIVSYAISTASTASAVFTLGLA